MEQAWAWLLVAGLCLQVMGVVALVCTLVVSEKIRLSTLVPPSLLDSGRRLVKTIKRRPPAKRHTAAAAVMGATRAQGYATVGIGPFGERPISEQIEVLRAHLNAHARELTGLQHRLDTETETRAKADDEERLVREAEIEGLRESMAEAKLIETRRRLRIELGLVLFGLLFVLAASIGAAVTG